MTQHNFSTKTSEYYTLDSGVECDNPDLGKSYYRLNCGNGDGFGFYENGEYIIHASKCSIERVGIDADKDINDSETFCPSKIILAEAGDIYFEAVGGDIILKGNNVYIQANGSEDDEGHILLNANNRFLAAGKDVTVNATDSIEIKADNSVVVSGRMLTNINGGLCTIADRHQFSFAAGVTNLLISGDIFNPLKLLDVFENFIIGTPPSGD